MEQTALDIGARLLEAREQRGLTLRDIATTTKISMSALQAIERNDFARLPGGIFRRAYVRAFAAEVGLNGDDVAREYCQRYEPALPTETLLRLETESDDRIRVLRRLAVVLVASAGMLIGGWLISGSERFADAPSGEERPHADDVDLPESTIPPNESEGTEDVALVAAPVTRSDEPLLRLEMRFNGPCWVSAMADGERVIYQLMPSGSRTLVEARDAIDLHVGNAGTVAYSINGAIGRPLGGTGEVVTVRITPDNFRNLNLYVEPTNSVPPDRTAEDPYSVRNATFGSMRVDARAGR